MLNLLKRYSAFHAQLFCHSIRLFGERCSSQLQGQKRHGRKTVYKYKQQSVAEFLSQMLKLPYSSAIHNFKQCPRKSMIKKKDIRDTIDFLRSKGFSRKGIAESIQICFYDRDSINVGLEKIVENEAELNRYGFTNGHTEWETNYFSNGTTERDKRLQLCLYYMELPSDFSGYGNLKE